LFCKGLLISNRDSFPFIEHQAEWLKPDKKIQSDSFFDPFPVRNNDQQNKKAIASLYALL